ncbi:UbiA prenyltransferase family [Mycena polygramma]|nr:UbiA prenyltransferase family [Mycena polygramma]
MTIDDLLDYDVDILVERTKSRPIPRGAISMHRAWLFFCIQVIIVIYSALAFLSSTALYISAAVFPLDIIYPTCKTCNQSAFYGKSLRWTNLAPIPLGLMFKVGVFMGWADVSPDGSVPWLTLAPVYIGACLWTMTYETVYQHQDKFDDIKIGLNSPALLFGENTIPVCTLFSAGFLSMATYGAIQNGQGLPVYVGLLVTGVRVLPYFVTS